MQRLCSLLVTLALIVPCQASSQGAVDVPNDTLAEVGRKMITARDLIQRMELMPWIGKDRASEHDSAKVKALQSLVAEQILALEAAAQGVAADSMFQAHIRGVEKLFVRDELFKQAILPQVRVTQKEIREGLRRFPWQVKVLMIGVRSRDHARAISRSLRQGADPDSIIRLARQSQQLTVDTINVVFGVLKEKQEDAVFALSEQAPASEPLEAPALGWLVLSLIGKESNPEYLGHSAEERTPAVIKKLRERKQQDVADAFFRKSLASRRAEARAPVLDFVTRTVHAIWSADSSGYRNDAGYRLDAIADSAEYRLRDHLSDIIVEMEDGGMTVWDVLESAKIFDFVFPTLEMKDFRQRFSMAVREIVAREYLARDGYKRKLDRHESVRHDVGTWSSFWLANAFEEKLSERVTVTDEDVMSRLIANAAARGRGYEVNVREVLSDSLKSALNAMEDVLSGGDMRLIARERSARKEWAGRDGESGFFRVSTHPELGFLALDADTGKLLGPVKLPEGYSVFVVLGKKRDPGVAPFDSLTEETKRDLFFERHEEGLTSFVATAAGNYGVKMYYDRLKRTSISPANMVTKRLIGFGGSMLAVPALRPMWGWVERARGVQVVLP